MEAFAWAEEAKGKLKAEFGDRLRFVGLQGSRARGEAREDSDIDLVVLLDRVSADKRQELIDLLLRWSEEVIAG